MCNTHLFAWRFTFSYSVCTQKHAQTDGDTVAEGTGESAAACDDDSSPVSDE